MRADLSPLGRDVSWDVPEQPSLTGAIRSAQHWKGDTSDSEMDHAFVEFFEGQR